MAKQAIVSHNRIEFDSIPMSCVTKSIIDRNLFLWDERWEHISTGTGTKRFFPSIQDQITIDREFKFHFKFTQILTNHGNLNSYLKRFGIIDQDYCDVCIGREDDALHQIYECERYANERRKFLGEVERSGHQWLLPTEELVKREIIELSIEFCHKII